MSKTRIELVNQALKNLGALAAGQTASADDFATVDGFVEPLFAQLAAENVVDVTDYDAIDDAIFLPLAVLLADAAKDEFGGGAFDIVTAERRIRRATAAAPTYETLRANYF